MFPNKVSNTRVTGNDSESTVFIFVSSGSTLDATVVDEGPGYLRYLRFNYKGDIFVENCDSVGPSLRQTHESQGSDRGLNGS